jgi:hypothetical protein
MLIITAAAGSMFTEAHPTHCLGHVTKPGLMGKLGSADNTYFAAQTQLTLPFFR